MIVIECYIYRGSGVYGYGEKYKINFGKSRADQKQTAKTLINQIFEINPTEDECDAICIGLAGLAEKNKKLSAF